MFKRLIHSFAGIRHNFHTYFVYEILSVLLTSFIWVPTYTFIYKKTLHWMGTDALINNRVLNVALNYKGMLGIAAIFLLCLMVIFVQIGLLIIISQKSCFHKEITLTDALFFVVRRVPRFFRLGILFILPFFLLFILITQSPLLEVVTDKYNVQIFLSNQLSISKVHLFVYCLIFVTLLYFLLRSLFAMHFIILKGQGTSKAIMSSFRITRRKEILMVLYLVLFNAVLLLVGFGMMYGLTWVIKLLVVQITNPLISNFLLTLSSYLLNILLLIFFPFNVVLVTNMFNRYTDPRENPEDEVIVRNHTRMSGLENRVVTFFQKKKYLLFLTLAVYLTITFLANYAFAQQLFNWNIIVASHRGYNLAPENSLSSIREAIDNGAQGVEIDVQMTKDGVLVLNHDETLTRVAGVNKEVANLTYEEIQQLNIGKSKGYDNEKIPTLDEALQEIKGKAIVIIDIKTSRPSQELAQKIVDTILANDMLGDAYVQSFSSSALKMIRAVNPDVRIGQILTGLTGDLSVLDVDFYTINKKMLSDAFVDKAHALGREVWVWTVNSDRNIREVLKYRVDGIISDVPYRVLELMAE